MARYVRLTAPDAAEIAAAFAELRESLEVSLEFPDEVLADAESSVRSPRLPDRDETAIPFVTIDPPESMDLDQALHLERRGQGYRVRYAIADVAAFVTPGGPMDVEAHKRGQTLYAPDGNARLYPPALSEGAGSLLPDEIRPAILWTMEVDGSGEGIEVDVRRALVRSREKLDYAGVQRSLEDGTAGDSLEPAAGGRPAPPGARGAPRRDRAADPRAGGRAGRERLRARVPRAAPGRGLERPDLADGRPGRGGADARRAGRDPPDAADRRSEGGRPAAQDREGSRRRLARRAHVRGRDPHARPGGAGAGGVPRRVDRPAPRLGLRRLRRRGSDRGGPCGRRRALCPYDRAAPAARRPLRR